MNNFNKNKIRSNFNKNASNYDANIILQKKVAENLIKLSKNHLNLYKFKGNILDLGSGTGAIFKNLIKYFDSQNLFQLDLANKMLNQSLNLNNIAADIENMPFKDNSFEIIFSSLSFQWLNNLEKSICYEIKKILKRNSILIFSILCKGTLKELKFSCLENNVNLSMNNFYKSSEIVNFLQKSFDIVFFKEEEILIPYKNIYKLLNSIRIIGAGYSENKNRLMRKDLNKIDNFYLKNFGNDGIIPSTWKVFYAICRKMN